MPKSKSKTVNDEILIKSKESFININRISDLKTLLFINKIDATKYISPFNTLQDLLNELKSEYCYLTKYKNKICISTNYMLIKIKYLN